MAGRRMVTTDIWRDEWFGQLDTFQQLVWVGLFSRCADDQGRMLDNPALIRADIFPYKDIPVADVETALSVYAAAGRIMRYEAEDKRYIQIIHWWEHQRPQWAQPSPHPPPPTWTDHVRATLKGKYICEAWPPPEYSTSAIQVDDPGGQSVWSDSTMTHDLDLQTTCGAQKNARAATQGEGEKTETGDALHQALMERAKGKQPDAIMQAAAEATVMRSGPQKTKDADARLHAEGWDLRPEEVRAACCYFIQATGIAPPRDVSGRKKWDKALRAHVENYGAEPLEEMYRDAMRRCRSSEKKLTIGWPGALTATLASLAADEFDDEDELDPIFEKPLSELWVRLSDGTVVRADTL